MLPRSKDAVRMMNDYETIWVMDESLSYEPTNEDSVAFLAQARNQDPLEVVMDTLAEGVPLLVMFGRYPGHLEGQRELIADSRSVFGLSDGGAHCGVLVDASVPTYMLTYFTRDRQRGPKMTPEFIVHKMTRDTAELYGLEDRGLVKAGFKADFNVIDYENLTLLKPEMVYDLPGGGKRLVQSANGYKATICSGVVTYRDGEHTGQLPGRLIRGGKGLKMRARGLSRSLNWKLLERMFG